MMGADVLSVLSTIQEKALSSVESRYLVTICRGSFGDYVDIYIQNHSPVYVPDKHHKRDPKNVHFIMWTENEYAKTNVTSS